MKFTPAKTKSRVSTPTAARGLAYALVVSVLFCFVSTRAQEAATPNAPQAPPSTVVAPMPAQPAAPQQQLRAPAAAPATTRVARPAIAAAPAAKPAPAISAMPPRQVVMVVHRLRGWKLLAWLATSNPSSLELDELPSPTDVHTNIVAGYVSDDGRTVVARLPQAEADLDDFPAPPSSLFEPAQPAAPQGESEYTVVTADGRNVGVKFVGLDATTGLSLLEAASTLMSNAPVAIAGNTDDPTVGQRVLIYTPAPTPVAAPTPGYVYVKFDEKEGRLTEVKSGPLGRPFRLVARTPAASDEWTGSVVANEVGDVIGIVSQTDSGGTQIVPVATVLGARERVMKLRASAPQPFVGIRGEPAFRQPLAAWVGFGWKPEAALPHIQSGGGVLLTKVAPGAPAALAGLKPGDLISRIGARDVRSVEDLSLTLKEAGVGSSLDFTVWRAFESQPLKFTVRLAGAANPADEFDAAVAADNSSAPELVKAYEAANPLRAFGLGGLRMTQRGAARLGARGGLLVVAVRPGSYAEECGLRAGDVIETANGAEFTLSELRRVLANHAVEPVTLVVVREGARKTLTYNPSEDRRP